MNPARRAPLHVPPALTVAVIVVCLAVIIWQLARVVPLAVAGQAYLLIIIALGFRYWPPFGRWLAAMPIPHRVVAGVLLGGMILGHFSLQNRKYFPFTAWKIFTFESEANTVSCREFIATTASGQTVRLLAEQLFPSIVQFNPPSDNNSPAMTHLVQALGRMYNRLHAADPVRRIDLVLYAVQLHSAGAERRDQPACELLRHYDISSDHSD